MTLPPNDSLLGREANFFLGRQPILNRTQNIVAYELLFRSADSLLCADFNDQTHASAGVILNALAEFGIDNIVGDHQAYINVDTKVFMSDAIELLPKDHVVLELLENMVITSRIVDRCKELKKSGFVLAIDDHSYSPEYEPLYPFIDVVKIDVLNTPTSKLSFLLSKLDRWNFALLAEKVETHEQQKSCMTLGFNLFQGYYFSRPEILNQKRIDPDRMILLRLLNQLHLEVEVREIEDTFRQHPNLIYNLLRLVNSVAFGLRERVTSIKQAILYLGIQYLTRWVILALYVSKKGSVLDEPLLHLASVRGKLMELLALQMQPVVNRRDLAERAFITGALSLIDALFNTTIADALGNLNLPEDILSAILRHEGQLGLLLMVSKSMEKAEFMQAENLIAEVNLSTPQLLQAQLETLTWAKGIFKQV